MKRCLANKLQLSFLKFSKNTYSEWILRANDTNQTIYYVLQNGIYTVV